MAQLEEAATDTSHRADGREGKGRMLAACYVRELMSTVCMDQSGYLCQGSL